jgi:hypothetical protein
MESKHKNRDVVEEHLQQILQEMCECVGVDINQWNIDKQLFKAIVNSDTACENFSKLSSAYDTCYFLAKKLNIKVNPRYYWFANICSPENKNN